MLAHSVEARYVYADPDLVKDPAGTAAKLSPLLGIAPSQLLPLMTQHKRAGRRRRPASSSWPRASTSRSATGSRR